MCRIYRQLCRPALTLAGPALRPSSPLLWLRIPNPVRQELVSVPAVTRPVGRQGARRQDGTHALLTNKEPIPPDVLNFL